MFERKYIVYSVREDNEFIQVLIKKESTDICKEYFIKNTSYGREFIYKMKYSSDYCKYIYDNHNEHSWIEMGKSLMTGKFITILLPR